VIIESRSLRLRISLLKRILSRSFRADEKGSRIRRPFHVSGDGRNGGQNAGLYGLFCHDVVEVNVLLHSYKIARTLPCFADPMKIRVIAEISEEIQ
jgi:hypothetical protein